MAVDMQAMGQLQRHIAHRIVLQPLGVDAQPSTGSRLSKCHRCGLHFMYPALFVLSLMRALLPMTSGQVADGPVTCTGTQSQLWR
jgi:hypothetical protein